MASPAHLVAPSEIELMTGTTGIPIMQQPQAAMIQPGSMAGCPAGLEYLATLNQILVHQQVELTEAFTGYETNNKYLIRNPIGQQIYFAAEVNDSWTRSCCGPVRPFHMKIMDNTAKEVIHLHRPYRCTSCLFFCCLQKIEVSSPPGTIIGYVKQNWSLCRPKFSIQNAAGESVLMVYGPCFTCTCCCPDVEFKIYSKDGSLEVGKIIREWTGADDEKLTDADRFSLHFPGELDPGTKATLLASTFLLDYMYYEHRAKKMKKPSTIVQEA